MKSLLRQVALACVVASVLPQVVAAADALHVLDHAVENGGTVTVASMVPAFHGHAHWADTPDHDHPVTAPASGSATSRARAPLQPALPAGCVEALTSCTPIDVLAVDERSANPRPTPVIPTVLRI